MYVGGWCGPSGNGAGCSAEIATTCHVALQIFLVFFCPFLLMASAGQPPSDNDVRETVPARPDPVPQCTQTSQSSTSKVSDGRPTNGTPPVGPLSWPRNFEKAFGNMPFSCCPNLMMLLSMRHPSPWSFLSSLLSQPVHESQTEPLVDLDRSAGFAPCRDKISLDGCSPSELPITSAGVACFPVNDAFPQTPNDVHEELLQHSVVLSMCDHISGRMRLPKSRHPKS